MADEPGTYQPTCYKQKFRIIFGTYWKPVLFFAAPVLLFPMLPPHYYKSNKCMYIILIMAIYWVTAVIPMYVTALFPVVLFPFLGILDTDTTCRLYFKDTVVFFIGGILLALSVQYSNLHKRIALAVVSCVGCSVKRVHIGLFIVTAFISNWQSNTATTAMMCPIVRAILEEFERVGICTLYKRKDNGELVVPAKGEITTFDRETMTCTYIPTAFYLSIAFASTIGGIGTIISSGTNLVLKGVFESVFPDGPGINFASFFIYFYPLMIVNIILAEVGLLIYFFGLCRPNSEAARITDIGTEGERIVTTILKTRYLELGPMSSHEILVACFFLVSVSFVFTRKPGLFSGWSEVYPFNEISIKDASALFLILIMIFIVPATFTCVGIYKAQKRSDLPEAPSTIMNWHYVNVNTPWGLVFLLGGGFAIAEGGKVSGMSEEIGRFLSQLQHLPPIANLAVILLLTNVLTEFTANVPTANVILPIICEMAIVQEVNPLFFLMPTAVCCAMAYMTAVGTPPNALAVSYGGLRVRDLAKAGFGVKIITYCTSLLLCPIWGSYLYKDLYEFPQWANVSTMKP